MISREFVKICLTGPVSPVRTPFLRDGSVDYHSLRSQIDRNISNGSKSVILTPGDSHYLALSDRELAQVARVTAEHAGRRAMVVAADKQYKTRDAVEFARYCRGIGIDLIMPCPPDGGASCTEETIVDHYAEVAKHMPIMIITSGYYSRSEESALSTLSRVKSEVLNVFAVKDDLTGSFARKMSVLVNDRWAVIAGGQKQNHMNMHPYGCDGYFSVFISFMPEIAMRYWRAVENNNLPEAASVISDFDMPFFKLIGRLKGGFDAGLHAVYEIFGICKRWRPAPYYNLNEAEAEQLKEGLESIGIK